MVHLRRYRRWWTRNVFRGEWAVVEVRTSLAARLVARWGFIGRRTARLARLVGG